MRRPAPVHGYEFHMKKEDGAIDSASFDVPLLFWFEYCLDKAQNATSKTLQSLLHSHVVPSLLDRQTLVNAGGVLIMRAHLRLAKKQPMGFDDRRLSMRVEC